MLRIPTLLMAIGGGVASAQRAAAPPRVRPAHAAAPAADSAATARARAAERRARKRRLERVRREVRALGRKLASPSQAVSKTARDALMALARRERIRGLGYQTDKLYHRFRRHWKAYRAERRIGLLAIRAQKVNLLGFDRFTTSLGRGSPVTLQLPRTRSVRVGTTVAVPLGSR